MPDVESRLARLEQRIIDIERRVDVFDPLVASVTKLVISLANLREDFIEFKTQMAADRRDGKQTKRWMIGIAVGIFAALISLSGLILMYGAQH